MRPDLLVPLEDLQAELARLMSRIKASAPTGGDVRLPGERAFSERAKRLQQGWLEIDRTVYDRLKAL
jgi:LDH2 family malate/lactate/ureidoglycolate dehydrogenase